MSAYTILILSSYCPHLLLLRPCRVHIPTVLLPSPARTAMTTSQSYVFKSDCFQYLLALHDRDINANLRSNDGHLDDEDQSYVDSQDLGSSSQA